MLINLSADYAGLHRSLDNLGRKQLPFAMASALTATVRAAAAHIVTELPTIFDRPTPFTLRGLAFSPATKATLTARVYVKPIQAAYLSLQETGGRRSPKRTALVIPKGIPLNAYGNIAKGGIARLKGRKDIFIGTIKGVGGVWRRPQRGKGAHGWPSPILLVRFSRTAPVKARFPFHERASRLIRVGFAATLPEALRQALATAR